MLAFAVSALPQARGADVSLDFIYDNLSGGNWIDVEGYGYGWQPDLAVSDLNWRPYSDGYWAYTDYGWTWISYEDFGWATYHYGRWANLADYGWVWFPGEDLDWGPAWVSWRTGGDYIGWAPLPPRGPGVVYEGQPIGVNVDVAFDIGPEYYNFCDVRFIGEPVLRDRIFPPVQNVTYITNTVNVTNITVQNNVVYNYGPDFAVVNRYSSRPIQRLTIERQAPTNLTTAVKSGTLTKVQGNKLLVAAPQKLATAPPTAKPSAVKAKIAQPKIERGWKGVPNKSELEQKIKAENPKNVQPPTRAAAREAGTPAPVGGTNAAGAERGPAGTPGARGRAGRVAPGGTAAPSLGESPSRVERERGRPGAGPRPRATAMPREGAERVSPPPFERGRGPGNQGERAQEPGAVGGSAGAAPRSPFGSAPAQQQEHGRQPARRPGEEQGPRQSEPGQNPPQSPDQRIRFGTPAPMGGAEREQRSGAPPSFRQSVTQPPGGEPAGQARRQRESVQGPYGRPPPPQQHHQQQQQQQQRGAPAGVEHGQGQGQPEGGKKRQPKETPPPGPR